MNIQKRAWQIGIFVGVVLGVYLITLVMAELKSISYIGSGLPATNTISVTGTGEAYASPDVATFSFGVTKIAKTVSDAQAQVTEKANAALKIVRDAGIKEEDIQTTNYSINPHYEYQSAVCSTALKADGSVSYCPPGKSVLTGYEVNETVTVKIRNLDKAGPLFASIGSLGVDTVNGLNFSIDNPDSVQAKARSQAIAEAKTKAEQLAAQLGVRIVRVTNFSEDNGSYRPMMYGMGGDAISSKAVIPEIATGQQKVTSNVSITYEIQ